jgi:cystathionine gamma-synthase
MDEIATLAIHAGEELHKPYGALTTPIVQTSTFTFQNTAEILDFMHRKQAGNGSIRDEYGRYSNPTQTAAEGKLAALEGGEQALLFSSGMAAITTTLLTFLSAGDHLIMVSDSYHRTRDFATALLSRWAIETTFVPIDQPEAFEKALRTRTRMIFSETPTNPYLRIADIQRFATFARQHNLISVVDSTFATPINLHPLSYGINLVIHSATKYLGGHNDLLAGVVIGSHRDLVDIATARGILGGVSNPNDAYLLLRGLKTLELRVRRQNESSLCVARFLDKQPGIRRVHYPGLPTHPDYQIACRQMSGFGGVVSFEIDGDFEKTGRFIDLLRLPFIGPTLGGVESIVQQPAAFFSLDPYERKIAGIKDNLVRYAVGLESSDDIIADLHQALAQL